MKTPKPPSVSFSFSFFSSAPAIAPATGFLLGCGFDVAPRLAVLAAVCGVALGRRFGGIVFFFALALLCTGLRGETSFSQEDLRRPVEIVGESVAHPRRYDDVWSCLLRVERLRRRNHVRRVDVELRLTIAADLKDAETFCRRGTRLRLRGEIRRTEAFTNYDGARPGPWRMRLKSPRLAQIERSPSRSARTIAAFRAFLDERLRAQESRGAALVRALLLGDRSGLRLAERQTLRRLGLAHLLAVSGLHVGLLGGGVFLLGAFLPRGPRHLLAGATILVYLAILGPRPSAMRAALMGWFVLASLLLRRPPQPLNSLACGVVLLLAADPSMLRDPGFQLSVSATAGILGFTPALERRWKRLPLVLRRPLAATTAAQIATMPWIIPLTGAVHPIAPIANLFAVPWLSLVLALSFLWVLAVPWSGPSWFVVLDIAAAPLGWAGLLPPRSWDLFAVSPNPVAAWTLTFCVAGIAWRPRLGILAVVLVGLLSPPPRSTSLPELVMLDVGQGDAIALRDGGEAILVDGGGWAKGDFGGRVLLPALSAAGIRNISAVVMTHPDVDHCGGLADLARYLPIGEILTGPAEGGGFWDDSCARRLFETPGARTRILKKGDVFSVGRWNIEVLAPSAGERYDDRNDGSLVLRASVGDRRVLLTGDLEEAGERRLLRSGVDLRAEILKVGHHGSRGASSSAFLAAVSPVLALTSAGSGNAYGHPSSEVLERLRRAGSLTLRTDLQGRLRIPAPGGRQQNMEGAAVAAAFRLDPHAPAVDADDAMH